MNITVVGTGYVGLGTSVKRGEVWIVGGGPGYAGKPRPAAIIQDDRFQALPTVTICPITTAPKDAPDFRLSVSPTEANGLLHASQLMVDKTQAVPRSRCQRKIGALSDEELVRLNRALTVFLGLAARAG